MTARYAPGYNDQKAVLKHGIVIPFTVLKVSSNIITLQLNFTNGDSPFKVSMGSVRQYINNIYRNRIHCSLKLMRLL